MGIGFGRGLTPHENALIEEYYKKNPKKLEKLKKASKEKPALVKAKKEQESPKFYTFAYLTNILSYNKIIELVETNVLIENVHYVEINGKRKFKQETVDLLTKKYVVTQEEKDSIAELFVYFNDHLGYSINKLAIEIAEITGRTHKSAYNFFYGFYTRKVNKEMLMDYKAALITLKQKVEEEG